MVSLGEILSLKGPEMSRKIIRNDVVTPASAFKERLLQNAGITETRMGNLLDESLDTLRANLKAKKTVHMGGEFYVEENSAVQVQAAKVLLDFAKAVILDGGTGGTIAKSIKVVVNTAENGMPIFDVSPSDGEHANGITT